MIGLSVQKVLLEEAVVEHGLDMESGKIDFVTFCHISVRFMSEEDEEGLREELKEILREIDSELTEDDLDNIIEEVDEDGSGTLDFDEFQGMMMG